MDITSAGDGPGDGQDPAELLAMADGLRDRRDWIDAAVAYAAYLRLRPDDWPIWVQYGHCMKESGDARAALLLYREAERLQPEDADLHLQIGHALKLLGRIEEAYQAYARALTLDPENPHARAELIATPAGGAPPPVPPMAPPVAPPAPSAPPPPPPPAPPPALALPAAPRAAAVAPVEAGGLLFDVSDLLDYFRANRAPTGIQRVQINLIEAALGQAPEAGLLAFDLIAGAWKPLPVESFRRLARLSREGAAVEDPDWAAAVASVAGALLRTPPAALAPGSRLVNLGSSWWIPDYLRRVREAKATLGLRYIPFLHDCIPLVVPEHCAAALVDEFARWFAGVALLADAVLCNSAATEADVRRLAARLLPAGSAPPPTRVIRLDAAPAAAGDPPGPPPPAGRPYVLFVGTIESRKNHAMVFNAWLALLRRLGPEATPDLVCVGKRGWLAEGALAMHANAAALRERVRLLHDIPDPALEALYRGARFTLYNSFHEGWGLPVTESLAFGKVPLVPDHSGLRESGAGVAVTFEPQNAPDLLAKLERLILDPGFLAAQEARIAREVRLRRWEDLAAEMLEAVAPGALPPPRPADPAPGAALGRAHPVALLPGPEPALAMALVDALREGPGWSVPEPWGCWTLPGTARLRLPVPPGTRGPLRLHLVLRGPPRPQRVGLRAPGPGAVAFRMAEIGAGEVLPCVLDLAEADAATGVEIACAEGVPTGVEGDVRAVGVGVVSVMACRPDDLAARLDWLEGLALPPILRL